jgi:hypothetical protein
MAKDIYHELVKQAIFLERHRVKLIIFDAQKPHIFAWKK